jgi:iron-sulfur cluster assembly protein
METSTQAPVTFSAGALNELRRLTANMGADDQKVLRIGVKGGGCSGMSYLLGFDSRKDEDVVYEVEGVTFVIDKTHEMYLAGMEIEWEGGLNSRGFTFKNPNASTTCGCGSSFAV